MRSGSTSSCPISGSAIPSAISRIRVHQGICGEYVLWATGLTRPEHFFDDDRLRDNFNHSAINLMKGGIVYSNFISTVSPQHAWEVTYPDQGMGLGPTLYIHREKFGGVLNGIDYEV